MNVEIINPLEYPNWDDLLLTSPASTFFQTSAWARVLHGSYNYKPVYFTTTENGTLSSLISIMEVASPLTGKRGVALPFTDFCPPMAEDEASLNIAIRNLVHYGKKSGWKYFEFRGGCNHLTPVRASATLLSHSLELFKGEQAIFKNLRGSNKRNIRRAREKNVEIKFLNTWEALKDFYRLHCITRKKHSLPPQPLSFFRQIYDHIISQKMGYVILAFHQNILVAGAVFFHFGKKAIFKFGASIPKYHNLRPNNLLMWCAIKHYIEEGYSYLSFGKTLPQHTGLLQFKRGWGPRERTIYYYRYDLARDAYIKNKDRFKFFYPIFGAMPIPMLRLMGKVLYRHFG